MISRIIGGGVMNPGGGASGTAWEQAVNALSPTSWWRMDEPSGSTAADSAGSNDGTYGTTTRNQTSLLPGDSNTSIINGAGPAITTTAAFDSTGAFSLVVFASIPNSTNNVLFSQQAGTGTAQTIMRLQASGLLNSPWAGFLNTASAYDDGNIHMFSCTFAGGAGGAFTLDVDGGAERVSNTTSGSGSTGNLIIGEQATGAGASWLGPMDEALLFVGTELSASQLATLYTASQ